MNKKINRKALENRATKLGYSLSKASRETKMRAVSQHEDVPRWEIVRSKWQADTIACKTLTDAENSIDQLEIMQELT